MGEKTARKEIHLLWSDNEEVGIDDLFEWLASRKEEKYQKYIDNEGLIRNNYKVVQLLELEVSLASIESLQNTFIQDTPKFNSMKFRIKLLDENISPSNLDNWMASFSMLRR